MYLLGDGKRRPGLPGWGGHNQGSRSPEGRSMLKVSKGTGLPILSRHGLSLSRQHRA